MKATRPAEVLRHLVPGLRPVSQRLFASLRKQEANGGGGMACYHLESTIVKVHPDGPGAQKKNGSQTNCSRNSSLDSPQGRSFLRFRTSVYPIKNPKTSYLKNPFDLLNNSFHFTRIIHIINYSSNFIQF